VHLRRALLLLALVFGLAAVVASLSAPPEPAGENAAAPPLRAPRPAPSPGAGGAYDGRGAVGLDLDARRRRAAPVRRELPVGTHVVASVLVDAPGEASIEGLGLVAFAEPRAPARFDLLLDAPESYDVRFDPLGEDPPRTVATLVAER
jgi:hypothetical protein